MTNRFTIDGSIALELELAGYCAEAKQRILQVIPERQIKALLLGGGYGRGEGGVLRTTGGDKPYNDLEFYILITGTDLINKMRYNKCIHQIAEELTSSAGIDVEFKLLSLRKLEQSPVTMFYYDLISGHRLVHGTDSWLATCAHHRSVHRIPLCEATRLLMNRCSGLLYSQAKLARTNFSSDDADFVGRNLAKAKLAFGDVILTMRGQYHSSCRERHKRLRKLEAEDGLHPLSSVVSLHAQGVDFKLLPVRTSRSRSELQAELESLKNLGRELWLHLESRRLGKTFSSIDSYSLEGGTKCPETDPRKNRLINLRQFGPGGLLDGHYPREGLLNSLPLLLWRTDALTDAKILSFLQRELRTSATEFPQLVHAYESLWRIYN
jgi:hypothetical protein